MSTQDSDSPLVATVTLNPAIDEALVIGRFSAGAVHRVERTYSIPGGKGVNVACMLANYGVPVVATGFLGSENVSLFEAIFRQKGIADSFVRISGKTRTSIKISDPILHQTTDINFPGLSPTDSVLDAFSRRLDEVSCDWVVLGGSLPPGVGPAFYRKLIASLKAQGKKVFLDASGEPFHLALDAAPHVIKPNREELRAILQKPLENEDEIIRAARSLVNRGVECVIVSMGSDGACFVTSSECVIALPPKVAAENSVGAGDAMVAGMLAGLLQKLSLKESARLATAFSLASLAGREVGGITREKIEAWLPLIVVRSESASLHPLP